MTSALHHAQTSPEMRTISRCPRRALLIGIQYFDHPDVEPIIGIKEDMVKIRDYLVQKWDYQVLVMTDTMEGKDASMYPTKANILQQLEALVADAGPGDIRLFCFAGHSSQILDVNGDEEDGKDEVLVPIDNCGLPLDKHGNPLDPASTSLDDRDRKKIEQVICDDDLQKILVAPLKRGVKLIALFDSCTSGTLLDLKHYWSPVKSAKDIRAKAEKSNKTFIRKPKRRTNTLLDGLTEAAVVGRRFEAVPRRSTFPPPKSFATRLANVGRRQYSSTLLDAIPEAASVISIACTEDSKASWSTPGMSLISVFLELVEQPEVHQCTWKDFMRQLNRRMCGLRLFKYAKFLKSEDRILTHNGADQMADLFHPQLGSETKSTFKDLVSL